jgi:hypothetical protein
MTGKFQPLPSSLDPALPYQFGIGSVLSESPYWARPSSLRGVSTPLKLARGFQGREFFHQFTMAFDDSPAPGPYPLHEICGTMTYRNMDTLVDGEEPGDPPFFDERLARTYVLNQTEGSYSVTTPTTGDVTGYPNVDVGDLPDSGSFWISDGEGGSKKIGYVRKYNAVDMGYLSGVLDLWMAGSKAFRSATTGGLYWGTTGAHRSESTDGYYAYVSGMQVCAQADLTEDYPEEGTPEYYGYDPAFIASAALVRRKNGPFIRDFSPLPPADMNSDGWGEAVYKSGEQSIELLSRIETRKWRDDLGTYSRRHVSAFTGMGWEELDISSAPIPGLPSNTYDHTSQLLFVGRDGVTGYRITLDLGNGYGEDFTSVHTTVLEIPPGEAVDHLFAAYHAGADLLKISKLEARATPEDAYEEIPSDSGQISTSPTGACRVLCLCRRREGLRWGHRNMGPYDSEEDSDTTAYYLTRRRIRDMKAETIV